MQAWPLQSALPVLTRGVQYAPPEAITPVGSISQLAPVYPMLHKQEKLGVQPWTLQLALPSQYAPPEAITPVG